MIKALLDTNALYSGIHSPEGTPGKILIQGFERVYHACSTKPILDELTGILERPRVRKDLLAGIYTSEELEALLYQIYNCFDILPLHGITHVVESDPDDSHVLSATIQNKVDYLVSGDKKHILPLKDFPDIKRLGIKVVSPKEFLSVLGRMKKK